MLRLPWSVKRPLRAFLLQTEEENDMIIVVKKDAAEEKLGELCAYLKAQGLRTEISRGDAVTLVGLIGDSTHVDADRLLAWEIVETVKRISEPFQKTGRQRHPADTVVEVAGAALGGGHFAMIAGPCSVESREQIMTVARSVKASGAQILRGGAYKPRSSPYDFQGLQEEGLALLLEAGAACELPVCAEIVSAAHLSAFEKVDLIQVGARNMQNYELLKELARAGKPVLLKRGFSATLKELLMAAEYLMSGGCEGVILCERGIRSFETQTRNTLDLSAVPALHDLSHLPVVVDPSHATGAARYVPPMALAAAAAGADGLMIEVHNDPRFALSDASQALTPEVFARLSRAVTRVRAAAAEDGELL